MSKDEFKRQIVGFWRTGRTCPCCREFTKRRSRKVARLRLKAADKREAADKQEARP